MKDFKQSEKKERKLYLVRHGKPDFPEGIRLCIGRTPDLALCEEGKNQAKDLEVYFLEHPVTHIFSSPLLRCRQTADLLGGGKLPVEIEEGLIELDLGEWEGVPLQSLKKDLESEPLKGEKKIDGRQRIRTALQEILKRTEGDIVCVSHAGILSCYLSEVLGTTLETSRALPQPYAGISVIRISAEGKPQIELLGVMPEVAPDEAKCEKIWDHYGTPEPVRMHCQAVAGRAVKIAEELNKRGHSLDLSLVRGAALLHDVARHKKNHPLEGARIVLREGYPKVAEIVARHHELQEHFSLEEFVEYTMHRSVHLRREESEVSPGRQEGTNESEIVYLADKLVSGIENITLEQRFQRSRKRCEESEHPGEALAAHDRRLREAKEIEEKIQHYMR